MSVDVGVVAGIGIKLNEKILNKFNIVLFNEDTEDHEIYLEERFESDEIYVKVYGSRYSGEINYCLIAKDGIKGIDLFLQNLDKHGFKNITINDLVEIKELLWC